ncbi:hypothetical protein Athai_65780 [Actinocatenispora thailandica]|uniref:Uncharacterized protein n=1 Tax=Actinocatenispora thailandica TaxID=227318 RepID=A0A7R7DWC2_9ACTN|nr:hypothetical protein [Actinocatenispora thailandica]BCJ39075.1 hypothetical protein Athai_65780 [Actinocatenispora thailandica]
MDPTGRDVGPFRGVTTVRVHGGFEICRGKDDDGRAVTILTMGPSAVHDDSLRGALTEAYQWARSHAPAGEDFAGVELSGEQPWVASLDAPGTVGVRSVFDRLVSIVRPPAPGRHTGNIATRTDTGSIPRVGSDGRPITADTGSIPRVGHDGRPLTADTGSIPRATTDTGSIPRAGAMPPGSAPPPGSAAPPGYRTPAPAVGRHTGQLPRIVESPTNPLPPVSGPARHTGQIPRVAAAHTGQQPRVDHTGRPIEPAAHTGQFPRIDVPTHQTGQLRPPGRPVRELPPMPAYQGRPYTAAPRPIAAPHTRRVPVGGGRALPILLIIMALGAIGVLALLVAAYLAVRS